jgi:hypothetical protein
MTVMRTGGCPSPASMIILVCGKERYIYRCLIEWWYIYIYIYIYMYIYIYIYIHVCLYLNDNTSMRKRKIYIFKLLINEWWCIYIRIYIPTDSYMYDLPYWYIPTHLYINTFFYIHEYWHACLFVWVVTKRVLICNPMMMFISISIRIRKYTISHSDI